MMALNPARFVMGHRSGSNTRPTRTVNLDAFRIGIHEVTFSEYDRYAQATGARRPDDFGFGRGNRPVVDVTWDEALAYTRWLTRTTGRRYRLPSEAEWEYAARAGTDTNFWWGSTPVAGMAVCMECGSAWDRRSTAPVGSLAANPFGLHDTAGNAAEWVADCYRPNYLGAPDDGRPVEREGCRERVVRGGSWASPAASLRSHDRRGYAPSTRTSQIGFRVAADD